jgi:hypothetical protein
MPTTGPAPIMLAQAWSWLSGRSIGPSSNTRAPSLGGDRAWPTSGSEDTHHRHPTRLLRLGNERRGEAAGWRRPWPGSDALYTLEIQRVREAAETPLPPMRGIGDAARQVAGALTVSALTGVLTRGGADGGRLAHDVVKSVAGAILGN